MLSRFSCCRLCLAGLTGLLVTAAAMRAPEADPLNVGEAYAVRIKLKAEGVQIYECKPKKDNTKAYEWVLKAPEAKLFDDKGKEVGKHFAGPTWEAADGSKIVAQVQPESMVAKPDAVAWLKLKVKSSEGKGLLTGVKYIQRVDTSGGLAPKTCDASYAGTELRVPYKATYVFYEEKK